MSFGDDTLHPDTVRAELTARALMAWLHLDRQVMYCHDGSPVYKVEMSDFDRCLDLTKQALGKANDERI